MHVELIEEVASRSFVELYYLRNLSLKGFRVLQLSTLFSPFKTTLLHITSCHH